MSKYDYFTANSFPYFRFYFQPEVYNTQIYILMYIKGDILYCNVMVQYFASDRSVEKVISSLRQNSDKSNNNTFAVKKIHVLGNTL